MGTFDLPFSVEIKGTPDPPTVIATSPEGNQWTPLAITIGGSSTDTDVALGRVLSEKLWWLIRIVGIYRFQYSFVNSTNHLVGRAGADSTWRFEAEDDLSDLHIYVAALNISSSTVYQFEATAVAEEKSGEGGDSRTTTYFNVTVNPTGSGGPADRPRPAVVDAGRQNGFEGIDTVLNMNITSDPGDTTSHNIFVAFREADLIAAGVSLQGVLHNDFLTTLSEEFTFLF